MNEQKEKRVLDRKNCKCIGEEGCTDKTEKEHPCSSSPDSFCSCCILCEDFCRTYKGD